MHSARCVVGADSNVPALAAIGNSNALHVADPVIRGAPTDCPIIVMTVIGFVRPFFRINWKHQR